MIDRDVKAEPEYGLGWCHGAQPGHLYDPPYDYTSEEKTAYRLGYDAGRLHRLRRKHD